MDDNRRIRKVIVIINIAIILVFAGSFSVRVDWVQRLSFEGFLFTLFFTAADMLVLAIIYDINTINQELIEKQEKTKEAEKQIAERKLQEKQKKLDLLVSYETAGRYEEAARICDEFQMWEKAGELRRMEKTSYLISTSFTMGKDGAISVTCPNCGSAQSIETKSNMVKCQHCGNNYIIPKKILDML